MRQVIDKPPKKAYFCSMNRLILLLVIFGAGISIAYFMMQPREKQLPVINPIDLEKEISEPNRKSLAKFLALFAHLPPGCRK